MNSLSLAALSLATVLAQTTPPVLRVSMIALGVKDMERSVKFYSETLGLPMKGKPGELTFFDAGSVSIALNRPLGRAAETTSSVEVIFPAESVSALHRILGERGCRFVIQPREVTPGLWAATFTDPDGHRLTILGPQ
jgi:predicted enzyme related to lactoylglutathione lyase